MSTASVQLLYIISSMKIAVTGSSGLIGSALVPALTAAGHDVVRLVRHEPAGPGEARWDIAAGTIDEEALQEVEAIVHLAGENIGQRWSDAVKKRVLDSRVDGTRLIAETAARLPRRARPPLRLRRSGSTARAATRVVDESSPRGTGLPRGRRRGLGGGGGAGPRRRPADGAPAPGHRPREAGRCAATAAPAVQARGRRPSRERAPVVELGLARRRRGGLPVRARAAARRAGQRDGARRCHELRVRQGARPGVAPAHDLPAAVVRRQGGLRPDGRGDAPRAGSASLRRGSRPRDSRSASPTSTRASRSALAG